MKDRIEEIDFSDYKEMHTYFYKVRLTFRTGKKATYIYSSDEMSGTVVLKELMSNKLEPKIFYTLKDTRMVIVSMVDVMSIEMLIWR